MVCGSHAFLFMIGLLATEAYRPENVLEMRVVAEVLAHDGQRANGHDQVQHVSATDVPARRFAKWPTHMKQMNAGADLRTMSVLVEVGSDIAVDFKTAIGWNTVTGDAKAVATFVEIGPPKWWARFGDMRRHFFTGISVAVLVKIACMVGNLLVQVSPLPQAQEWEGKGTTGGTESAPYVAMGLGGWQWCTYGFAAWVLTNNDGFLILVYANCLGALLGSYYTFVFYQNCRDSGKGQNLRKYLLAVSCLVVVQILIWLEVPHARALALHSCIAGLCSFMGAASLLSGLPAVLRSGDTSGICSPLVIAYFFGALIWAYYGVLMNDDVVISVNIFAAFSSAACLYAKFFHPLPPSPEDSLKAKCSVTKFVQDSSY